MKKLLAFVLAMIMLLSFVGCGNQEEVKEGLTIEDVVGYWESPNRVGYGTNGEVMWDTFTLTLYEDGSGVHTYIFHNNVLNSDSSPSKKIFTYRIENNKLYIEDDVLTFDDLIYTYDNSGSTPKLMASMAEGYWYEKVSE